MIAILAIKNSVVAVVVVIFNEIQNPKQIDEQNANETPGNISVFSIYNFFFFFFFFCILKSPFVENENT